MIDDSEYFHRAIEREFNKRLFLNEKGYEDFDKCWICFEKDDAKVKDHDHITKKYRGLRYQVCNLNLTIIKKSIGCVS